MVYVCILIEHINIYIILCNLEKQRKTSVFRKLFLYPTFMLLLLALTVVTVLLVVQNLLLILIGIKALPLNTRVSMLVFQIYKYVNSIFIFFLFLTVKDLFKNLPKLT